MRVFFSPVLPSLSAHCWQCFGPPAAASEMLRGFLNPTSIRGTIRSVCILAVLLLLIRAAQQQLVAHWAEPPSLRAQSAAATSDANVRRASAFLAAGSPLSALFTASASPDASPSCIGRPAVRYVRVSNDPVREFITLNEIVALDDGGVNVALGKICSASSVYDPPGGVKAGGLGFGCATVVDGARSRDSLDGFFHSGGWNVGEFVEVDLGAAQTLSAIEVYNRNDAAWMRLKGQQLQLLDVERVEIASWRLAGTAERQRFDVASITCPSASSTDTVTRSLTASFSRGASPSPTCAPPLSTAAAAAAAAWDAPAAQPSRVPRAPLAAYWLVISAGAEAGAADALAAVRAGPRLRLAVQNLGMRVLLVLPDGVADDAAVAERVMLAWRAQLGNPPYNDRIVVWTANSTADAHRGLAVYAPLSAYNAALLRAVELGAKVVYDWLLLLRPGGGGAAAEIELELETGWPVLLPEVLPGAMATTAALPAGADRLLVVSEGSGVDGEVPAATDAAGVRPALLLHCVRSSGGGDSGTDACDALTGVTALAPGAFFTPPRSAAGLSAHVRVVESAALPTLFLPRLQLQPPAASADAAWLSLAVRDIFAQRLAADVGHAALLVPRIGFFAAATAAEPPLPLSPASAELAAAAAAAASAWVYRTVDADPWPRAANAGHATRRAAHLLQEMCDRMAAAHTPSLLAAGACAQLLGDLAHWQRGLASAHFELIAQPNCSRRLHDDAPPGVRRPPLAQRVAACQAAAAAERSAWLAANPLISSCAGRSIVPYYRRWRWAAAPAPAAASGWRLDWAGADTPLPGSEPVAPLPPPVQLYPTPEGVAALRRSIAEHNESGRPGPFLVPDDVVVYEFSHGRCELLHAARRSWAGLGRHHVAFSTVEDARIEAVTCRPIRPDWAAVSGDGRNSAFYPAALQHLYELGRAAGARLFINFDSDAVPLWPALLHVLRQGQAAHGGRYAWLTSGQVEGLTRLDRMLFDWEASGSELHKMRLALGESGGAIALSGFMYAFNLSALHDLMAVVETCPIVAPGDGMMGGLLACAGRALQRDVTKERGTHRDPGWMPDGSQPGVDGLDFPLLRRGGGNVSGLYGDFPGGGLLGSVYPGAERTTVYHRLKDPGLMQLLYDAFYPPFGWPRWSELPERNHHNGLGRCAYAPPGVHAWEWGRAAANS